MKCELPDSDQSAEFCIYANGLKCMEHILPQKTNDDPTILECFIPVSDNDNLSVKGHFSGSVLTGRFDLVADGSFLLDRRIESPNEQNIVFKKRPLDFPKVFDVPPGDPTRKPMDKVVEGQLFTKPLKSPLTTSSFDTGNRLGVGTIAIVISVNQECRDLHNHTYESYTCGEWKTRPNSHDNAHNGGVSPTHHLIVRVTDENVSAARRIRHIRHFEQARFGTKPWATFLFHYRSRKAIDAAGCIPNPEKATVLPAVRSMSFIKSTPNVQPKSKQVNPEAEPGKREAKQTLPHMSRMFTPTTLNRKPTVARPVLSSNETTPQGKEATEQTPKKRLGGSLNLLSGPSPGPSPMASSQNSVSKPSVKSHGSDMVMDQDNQSQTTEDDQLMLDSISEINDIDFALFSDPGPVPPSGFFADPDYPRGEGLFVSPVGSTRQMASDDGFLQVNELQNDTRETSTLQALSSTQITDHQSPQIHAQQFPYLLSNPPPQQARSNLLQSSPHKSPSNPKHLTDNKHELSFDSSPSPKSTPKKPRPDFEGLKTKLRRELEEKTQRKVELREQLAREREMRRVQEEQKREMEKRRREREERRRKKEEQRRKDEEEIEALRRLIAKEDEEIEELQKRPGLGDV